MTSTSPVAWLVSRFPTVADLSLVNEMDELERSGVDIEFFSLRRHEPDILHAPAVARLADMTAGIDPGFWSLLATQFRWLRRRPGRLVKAWFSAVTGSLRSLRLLRLAFVVVPMAAFFAERMQERGVVQVHARGATQPALAAYVINLLTGIPYSVIAAGHDLSDNRSKSRGVRSSMLAKVLRPADQVITRSTFNRQKLVEAIPELDDRCAVVRSGVPRASVVAVAPVRDHADGSAIDVCCVASLERHKGHQHLLRACRRLVERGNDVRCTIAGSGPELASLEKLVDELELGERVRFVGAVDGPSVGRLLVEADVFVSPGTAESSGKSDDIPVALVEAMAAGTSVVASRLAGNPELVAHEVSGLLVEPGDEDALVLAVERIVANPERAAAMASAALGRIEAEFTIEHNAARLATLLGLPITVPEIRIALDRRRPAEVVIAPPPPQLSRN